jgi:hypothetical protein
MNENITSRQDKHRDLIESTVSSDLRNNSTYRRAQAECKFTALKQCSGWDSCCGEINLSAAHLHSEGNMFEIDVRNMMISFFHYIMSEYGVE